MKRKTISFFLLFFFVLVQAQNYNIDSLQQQLASATSDYDKFEAAIYLIDAYAPTNVDSSIIFFEKALELAKKDNNTDNIIISYNNVTDNLMSKGAYPKAKKIIDQGIALGHQLQNDSITCSSLMTLVTWHWEMSNTKQSFEAMEEALDYANRANSKKYKAMIYSSYGIFYGDQGDFEKEREYFEKSLAVFKEINDTTNQIIMLQNLANSYFYIEDYPTALKFTNLALEQISPTDGKLYQHVVGFKANILYNSGKKEIGFTLMDSVLVMAKRDNNSRMIVLINNEKAKWLVEQGKYDKAIKSATMAVQLCKETGYIHQLPELCNTLSRAFQAKKDFESALNWTNEENKAMEEMEKRQQEDELVLMEANNEIRQKENENQILLLENRNQKMLIALISALAILFFIAVFYFFKKQQRKKLELFRQKIAADLHDEVGSNLNSITRIAKGLKSETNNLDINKKIEQLVKKSNTSISNVVDLIWALDEEESKMEDLIEKMEACLDGIKLTNQEIKVQFFKDNIPLQQALAINTKHHVLMVFKEAINNIQKHTNSSLILIELASINQKLKLKITNSFASKKEATNSSGRGLNNIQNRIDELGGTVKFTSTDNQFIVDIENVKIQ